MIDAEQLEELAEYKYLGRLITSGNEMERNRSENNVRMEKIWRV